MYRIQLKLTPFLEGRIRCVTEDAVDTEGRGESGLVRLLADETLQTDLIPGGRNSATPLSLLEVYCVWYTFLGILGASVYGHRTLCKRAVRIHTQLGITIVIGRI